MATMSMVTGLLAIVSYKCSLIDSFNFPVGKPRRFNVYKTSICHRQLTELK